MRLRSLASPGRTRDLGLCIAWSEVAEDARFELARGCPQHAFQQCASAFNPRPGPFVTWDNRNWRGSADTRELRRSETTNETAAEAGGMTPARLARKILPDPDARPACASEPVAPCRVRSRHQLIQMASHGVIGKFEENARRAVLGGGRGGDLRGQARAGGDRHAE